MRIIGVLNVTPDSFSDGGQFFGHDRLDHGRAVDHGLEMWHSGAHFVDVGGESTRPGAAPVAIDEELRRIAPVVRELAAAGVAVSIDTTRAAVAHAALELGAVLVNDVSGGTGDPDMLAVVAASGADFVVMHSAGPAGVVADYGDVVADVRDELARRVDRAVTAGVAADRILIDPGIGFSKSADHNWELLRRLDEIAVLGRPMLVGVSRKRFLRQPAGVDATNDALDAATAAITARLATTDLVWGVRVHDVSSNRIAAAVGDRLATPVPTE